MWLYFFRIFKGTYNSIQGYLSYSVNVNYQTILESPTEFPAVSICNLNSFDLTTYSSSGTYINNALINNNISPNINLSTTDMATVKVDEASAILKSAVISDKTLNKTTLQRLGFSMETMLISCYYNGIQCNSSDFSWFRTFEYGNCYTFNGLTDSNGNDKDPLMTSKSGPSSGLTIELFIGVPGKQDFYTTQKGAYIVVHNRSRTPSVKYEGITVQSGTASSIGVSRTVYSKLGKPFSNCRKDVSTILSTDSEIFKQTRAITEYSQKLCYELCLQNLFIIPDCKCADPTIPIVDENQFICNNFTLLECVRSKRNFFDSQPIGDICDSYCPLECDSTEYETSVSTAEYPTDYYLDILKQQSNFNTKFVTQNTFSPGE